MGSSLVTTSFTGVFFLLAGSALAGTGISTTTFVIPNNTGSIQTGLNVTLSTPANSITSNSFSTVSASAPSYAFSNGSVDPGFNDQLFQQTALSGAGNVIIGLDSYYWTNGGGSTNPVDLPQPSIDVGGFTCLSPVCYTPYGYQVSLDNGTSSPLPYDEANLTVNGTQVLSNASGTLAGNSSVTLVNDPTTLLQTVNFSFRDDSSGVMEDMTFTAAPEPGTFVPGAALLVAVIALWRVRRRARA